MMSEKTNRRRSWAGIGAATVLLSVGTVAIAGPPAATSNADEVAALQARVAALENRLAKTERTGGENWLTETRAREIRTIVEDVLADADTRASLLGGSGFVYGSEGLVFRSLDGDSELKISGQLQTRFVFNNQDDSSGDTTRWGFENRRTKVAFKGKVSGWDYSFNGAFSSSSGSFGLEDAYIGRSFDNGWKFKVGQFKPPFLREELTSSKRQLAVERSLVNEAFNQDRTQGIQFETTGDQVRFYFAVGDGFKTKNTPALTEDNELSFTGRVQFLAQGEDWGVFKDFTSMPGAGEGIMFGAAAHYEKEENGTLAGPEEERFTWTLDASLEFDGANVYIAFIGNSLNEADVDQYGIVAQGGYFFTDDCEGFIRYEWGDQDMVMYNDLSVLTVGINKYYAGHKAKATFDVGYGFNEVSGFWDKSGAGWREDAPSDDGQIVFRSQLQILF